LAKNPLSDDVGYVKHVLSTLQPALKEERHFALDGNALINQGSLVIHTGQDRRSDPSISSISDSDHDYQFGLPVKGAGCPINIAVFYCTP